ncbi:MAG TPA: trehalose-phosphatase [candidate division Zixibacteria bacterium]|nr:trehalose-phosphatase [candidate division Zixibacteria bacterium]
MRVLNHSLDLEQFYKDLDASRDRVLMLDYDGTLAPFRNEREHAYPYPELIPVLRKLADSTRTRLIIVSGRSVEMLKMLLGMDKLPEVWGCHGLEHLSRNGEYSLKPLDPDTRKGLEEIENWVRSNDLEQYVERKPSGIAFHWRGLPEAEAKQIREKVTGDWTGKIEQFHLAVYEFDGGLELRMHEISKADAVAEILNDSSPGATLAYCGDDFTDEDAFRALGEHGLKVLVRTELRDTEADLWLIPPDELVEFLRRWI